MKTVHYKGVEHRVIEDRGSRVVIGPANARTPRQVVSKTDLDAEPVKKKAAKAKATKKKATKKARARK